MLEGLVAWVLNNYLGKYVENLNTDQLSVALPSGKVELENLPLKKDAFRHLGLPVEVKTGFIGKVQLHVPVRQIRSAPWLISIEKIYVVAVPINLDEWDGEVEANIAHERKVALLDELEAQWRAEHEASDAGYYATSYSSWLSYGTGLLASIVENLQLKLHDVHIRYEDALTCSSAFACGLTVESLTADSCDASWQRGPALIAPENDCSFKILDLQKLAVYWDPVVVPTGLLSNYTLAELTIRMSETWRASHSYLLSPSSALARVRRERCDQPLRSRTRPRIKLELQLDDVALNLNNRQYGEAVSWWRGLWRTARLRESRAARPLAPPAAAARAWWIYALKCHCPDHTWMDPKPTWGSCLIRARKAIAYVETCLYQLNNPAATLSAEKKAEKDDFEWNTPLHLLKPLREIAMRRVPKSASASGDKPGGSGRSMLVHWFPQWWGWYSSPAQPEPPPLEEEILDVIADSIENNTLLKRDTVFGHFEFTLNKASLNLSIANGDGDGGEQEPGVPSPSLELECSRAQVCVESRPRSGAHCLRLALGGLLVRDLLTPGTLYPVLVAQGEIREVLSAMNASSSLLSRCRPPPPPPDPLFQLVYEKKPAGLNCDYKVYVKCQSLEVVWARSAWRWARQFAAAPWGSAPPAVGASTRQRLLSQWHHIMQPDMKERRTGQVELDISAPQIFLVEDLRSRDAPVLVVDFGRMRLTNGPALPPHALPDDDVSQDDEERFMTPCSTPPGSLLSPASPPEPAPLNRQGIDAANIHKRLYDSYNIELSDLQILVGRARDNWKYAHTKSTSSLHLLDRFSISLQAERRVIETSDPQYPSATLRGTLPALVVHLSEQKVAAARAVLSITDFMTDSSSSEELTDRSSCSELPSECSEQERSEPLLSTRFLMLQFAVDQMSLEVQSLGRSIAEVQVCGVRVSLAARAAESSLALSVHSLLLVDALQTYGPDFELLVASHKHVGMDCASGSILGSEPTSPTSPTSPLSPLSPATSPPPAPLALQAALHDLHASTYVKPNSSSAHGSPGPSWQASSFMTASGGWGSQHGQWSAGGGAGGGGGGAGGSWGAPGLVDSEALIAVELCFVKGDADSEDLRIANILFNNLDIIANQETIVELIGFAQRVTSPQSAPKSQAAPNVAEEPELDSAQDLSEDDAPEEPPPREVRTEITFDFHRLGVLLLRAETHHDTVVAKKIATATLNEAKIQATIASSAVCVSGSLGGAGAVALGGCRHARVLAAGGAGGPQRALTFSVSRRASAVELRAHVASVWYTHSAPLLADLSSCVGEFRQYLANLARSIRAAAADMAIGLVQPRGESLYSNPKLSQSMEGMSPRRRTISIGNSVEDPADILSDEKITLSVSVELESPVVVVPRTRSSGQVLVAHLGRMSLSNAPAPPAAADYSVRVRDISIVTLDTTERLKSHGLSAETMPLVYDVSAGRPVLHDTALQLSVHRDIQATPNMWVVSGRVVGGLRVTSTRAQYEQVLDTLQQLAPPATHRQPAAHTAGQPTMPSVVDPGAVPTLQLDPAVRAQVLAAHAPLSHASHKRRPRFEPVTVNFQLPNFTVELRSDFGSGERSLVDLSFREFNVNYEKLHPHETNIQMSLHSITMEDLTQEPDSKHRLMMVSHTPQVPKAVFVSKSCPQLVRYEQLCSLSSLQHARDCYSSLPADLHVDHDYNLNKRGSRCGVTPPCSPTCPAPPEEQADLSGEDDLVRISVHIRHPQHPEFDTKFNRVSRLTKVEFNCLKLVVSMDSWVVVLDFFGIAEDEPPDEPAADVTETDGAASGGATPCPPGLAAVTRTEVWVQSLWVEVWGVCRARAARLHVRAQGSVPARTISAELGALALQDLAPHHQLWRDRLATRGQHALKLNYRRLSPAEALSEGYDTSLSMELGPATYAHTKRFVAQLQAAGREYSRLRTLIQQARQTVSAGAGPALRRALSVRCTEPVIALPVTGRTRAALLVQLDSLTLTNSFKKAEEVLPDTEPEQLEVRAVTLCGARVWAARGGGALRVRRVGPPLLPEPATLNLTIEINLSDTHNVPDMTLAGTLHTLSITLEPAQYAVVRGVLAHNLGDDLRDLAPPPPATHTHHGQKWTTMSIKLELTDVTVRLEPERGVSALACVNFIKSRLLVETYSDLSQDIDLVSQEILVSDTRFSQEPANRRGNVFSRIVQPLPDTRHSVQAEVHARRRGDTSAYTILINNMRLMAILDWWEAAHQFIMQPLPPTHDHDQAQGAEECWSRAEPPPPRGTVELKLNITDSQLVLVEDASLWDTNAVILKSTTVITYRGAQSRRPVSCVLNELELFSCVLGLEEETALAIVDPCALHVDLRDDTLHLATRSLNLRLSYHDMRMFAAMMKSLPAQVQAALSGKTAAAPPLDAPANSAPPRAPRLPLSAPPHPPPPPHLRLTAVHVEADCITLCVIDDCLDSDVPLLEVSLSDLQIEQDLRKVEEALQDPMLVSSPVGPVSPEGRRPRPAGGRLAAALSVDYYNRTLSGWEPFIEPWKFETCWEYTLSSRLRLGRLQAEVSSAEVLDLNVTSTLIDLARLVRRNWTADYYAPQGSCGSEQSPKGSPAGHRRRSPFVPYALRNNSGHRLWFTTLLTTSDMLVEETSYSGPDDSWVCVRSGDTEPFSFGGRARGRGGARPAAAPARLHQLALRLDGWAPPSPVCVDRVGVYWRTITHTKTNAEARIVLEVSLEGSARKLVTVRSALVLANHLPHPVEVRVDQAPLTGPMLARTARWAAPVALAGTARTHSYFPPYPIVISSASWSGGGSRTAQVAAGASWAAPVWAGAAPLWVRPLARAPYPPSQRPIDWRDAPPDKPARSHYRCDAPGNNTYRFCCISVRERFPPDRGPPIAGHTLTLVPELRLENLLPLEMQYRATALDDSVAAVMGAVAAGDARPFHELNVEEGVEIVVKLEGFGWSSPLSVNGDATFTARLTLRDTRGRRLYLLAAVSSGRGAGLKVSVSAAYWLINRVGLPLVFRAEGGGELAGQFEEHEVARARTPLLFAFAEAEGGPTISMRLGSSIPGNPEWCSPFGLGLGVAVKKLEVRGGPGGERVCAVGVAVRAGRGRYRRTNIVTLAPRYQLHNRTRHTLQFAQRCAATTLNDPGALATHATAPPGCQLPWHWPRWDREQLLSARLLDEEGQARTAWSGGARVAAACCLHLACREPSGGYVLLRLEVVAQAATLFVLVSEAESAPPPLRIENRSAVAIMFHQGGCSEESVVGARASTPWALPEPEGAAAVCLRAPGGPRLTIMLDQLGQEFQLQYQNFLYIAFTSSGTAALVASKDRQSNGAGDDDNVLVLEVPIGSTKVLLGKKRYGDRSQLWRCGPNDQMIHEGSSPPQPTDVLQNEDTALSALTMVLDIEGPAPRPGSPAALCLRRLDARRVSTQAWRLLAGRMHCAHDTLAVQAKLTPGSRAVLGMSSASPGEGVPAAQAIQWQSLRPGSGRLRATLHADGPTRVVRLQDPAEGGAAAAPEEPAGREWGARAALAGVGVSLVSRAPAAELLYARLSGLRLELARGPRGAQAALAVDDLHLDNQLAGTPSPVLLYCLPRDGGPALHAAADLAEPSRRYKARLFRHLVVSLRPLAVRLEERLVLRLCRWAGLEADDAATEEPDEPDHETYRLLEDLTGHNATRYYFGVIKLIPSQIRLSMCTANKLEGELSALKKRLGLTLIKFEDAAVELEPFVRWHTFETAGCLGRDILKHFKDELKWQAAKILGSVDFLGNPLGFVADVSEGVSGLIYEGNVGALVKNVTHGISNSAAKVTESLGDGLERVVVDEAHEETRRRIRSAGGAGGGGHLSAGLRGLGLGLLGGVTSLVKHSYEGAQQEGLPGFLTGVGKGLVGTVTKPVIGVLDLAAETAAALRDSARRADRHVPSRVREPRCSAGPGGLLPRYCAEQAAGARLLYRLNGGDYSERFLAYRPVRGPPHDIRALLSSRHVRIFTCKHGAPHLVMETPLAQLVSCAAVCVDGAHYVELGVRGDHLRRPRVQADSADLAQWVARAAALARQLHHDAQHTLGAGPLGAGDDG